MKLSAHLVYLFLALILTPFCSSCASDGGGTSNTDVIVDDMAEDEGPQYCGGIICHGLCCNNACVNGDSSSVHCGTCNNPCGADEACMGGVCVGTCEGGLFSCEGDCVDLNSSHDHCGSCGFACGDLEVCSNGQCQGGCASGLNPCDGSCVDLLNDEYNCGTCGLECGTSMQCVSANCVCETGFSDCDGDRSNGCEREGGCECNPGETRPCYTGRAGTEDVGVCQGGTQECLSDGSGYGNCDGQVVPTKEICGNNLDDDCDHETDENADLDGDGWGSCEGDCCDDEATGCAVDPALVNPGAFDFPSNSLDDDCDGTIDNAVSRECSSSNQWTGTTATALAQALDICQTSSDSDDSWGLISAELLKADGTPQPNDLQTAVLTALGGVDTPRFGNTMVALSSGTARGPGDPGYQNPYANYYEFHTQANAPLVYTSAHGNTLETLPTCPNGDTEVNDSVLLRLKIRVPTNAQGLMFNHRFYSSEYPIYLCTSYNDFFLALLDSDHDDIPNDHNISFDQNDAPVSVNNAFFTTCAAQNCGYSFYGQDIYPFDGCPDSLECTGGYCVNDYGACTDGAAGVLAYVDDNDQAGATSWLTTQAPVVPGEVITLDFHIWDTSDAKFDSLVLLDNFEWRIDPTSVITFN